MKRAKNLMSCHEILFQWCSSKAQRRRKLLDQGAKRIDDQLDIVAFLRTQFLFKDLLKVVWSSKAERYLAKRQYSTFVLDRKHKLASSSSDGSPAESDEDSKVHPTIAGIKVKNKHVMKLFHSITGNEVHLDQLASGVYPPTTLDTHEAPL